MLHVLWVILKIILIILAVILGLVLLIVLLVLFAPIRYKVNADVGDDIAVTAKVRFLIVSVNVIFEKNEKKLDTFLRILGIKLTLGNREEGHKKEKKPGKKKKKRRKNKDDVSDETDTASVDVKDPADYESRVSEEDSSKEDSLSVKTVDTDKALENESTKEDDLSEYDLWDDNETLDEDEKKLFGRIKRLFKKSKKAVNDLEGKSEEEIKETLYQKLEKKVNQISDKKNEIENKINRFKKFWNMKCTVRTREYLGKYLISILKHIAPKSIKGHMRYGFDEPCTTGQVTGYLSLLPFVYQKGFSLEPDFYKKVLEGNVTVKGRIILGYIARIALKRYIWQTIKMARKI